MTSFWHTVETSAAREFGARHYRFVLGLRLARKLAPVVAALVAAVLLVLAVVQYVVPGVTGAAEGVAAGAPAAGRFAVQLVPALVLAAVALVVVPAAVLAWRRWGFEVECRAPWLSGPVAGVLGSVLFVGLGTLIVWPW